MLVQRPPRWRTTLTLLALVPLLATGCEKADGAANIEATAALTTVEVVELETVDFHGESVLTGQTEASHTVTVSAEHPGRILSTNFEEGSEVIKGQWLARIDAQTDRTRIGQLQVALAQTKRDRDRTRSLLDKGLATPADLERIELAVQSSEYNLKMTRQGVGKATAQSPIDGTVDRVHLEAGEYAMPGAPIATIVDYATIIVRAGLPESDLPYAKDGLAVKVHLIALDTVVDGVIKRVGIEANPRNRTFPLQVEVDNADRTIRPGMRAEVVLPTVHVPNAVMVPRTAVMSKLDHREVAVLEDHTIARRAVEIGPGSGDLVLVTKGLSSGDKLVVVGQRLVSSGEKVRVTSTAKCCRQKFKVQEAEPVEAPSPSTPTPLKSATP